MIETNTKYTWTLPHPVENVYLQCSFHNQEAFDVWKDVLEFIEKALTKYDKKATSV
jgi:hypothetical protein